MLLSREFLITPLVACFCILGISLSQYPRLQKLLTSKQSMSVETLAADQQKEGLRLELLKEMPTFGYDNLIADWLYIDFLQYFGDNEVREKIGYTLSPEFFEIILKHDPKFLEAYLNLSVSSSLYAGMPERTITLIDKGLKSLSPNLPAKSYYIWRYKGTDELLFLGDSQAARNSFLKAAEWASQHNDQESKNVVVISRKTAEFLQRNPDSKFARIATWTMVLQNNVDEKTRKRAIKEIENLGGKVVINADGVPAVTLPEKD
jgi:tetratricopeptide (TPR) repeat protein